jgi:hypothetical protein
MIKRHTDAIHFEETMRYRAMQARFCTETAIPSGVSFPDDNVCALVGQLFLNVNAQQKQLVAGDLVGMTVREKRMTLSFSICLLVTGKGSKWHGGTASVLH